MVGPLISILSTDFDPGRSNVIREPAAYLMEVRVLAPIIQLSSLFFKPERFGIFRNVNHLLCKMKIK